MIRYTIFMKEIIQELEQLQENARRVGGWL